MPLMGGMLITAWATIGMSDMELPEDFTVVKTWTAKGIAALSRSKRYWRAVVRQMAQERVDFNQAQDWALLEIEGSTSSLRASGEVSGRKAHGLIGQKFPPHPSSEVDPRIIADPNGQSWASMTPEKRARIEAERRRIAELEKEEEKQLKRKKREEARRKREAKKRAKEEEKRAKERREMLESLSTPDRPLGKLGAALRKLQEQECKPEDAYYDHEEQQRY